MNDKRRVLGRGLEALVPAARGGAPAVSAGVGEGLRGPTDRHSEFPNAVQVVAVDLIDRNPYQTRRHFDEVAMAELAASVRSAGVVQPIVVRPAAGGRFQLIVGERRWLAAQRAGLKAIPAVVREATHQQSMEITIIENLQREDLNAMEQAYAYERLSSEFSMTQEQMAQRTGKDRSSVANYLRLLKLPATVQGMVEKCDLSFGHAKALMMLENADLISRAAGRTVKEHLSVRQTEALVTAILQPGSPGVVARKTAVDPNVREAERGLQQALGVRVQISDRKGKGKIILQYSNLEDFDRILERLTGKTIH